MTMRRRFRLDLGPILRSLGRQRSASSLVVLELATGFATISCVLLASAWYQQLANRREMLKLPEDKRRHVSAAELLDGMRDCAIQRFGYLARLVWESWGIYSTSDWGHVIFNLIGAKLMQANEGDKLEDFEGVYDFESVFDQQWNFDRAYHSAKNRN
jgi:uncharacterized repeat protein (TIGR04138 family)